MNEAEKYKKTQLKNLEVFKEGDKYVISEGLMEATIEAVYAKGFSDGFTEGIK